MVLQGISHANMYSDIDGNIYANNLAIFDANALVGNMYADFYGNSHAAISNATFPQQWSMDETIGKNPRYNTGTM